MNALKLEIITGFVLQLILILFKLFNIIVCSWIVVLLPTIILIGGIILVGITIIAISIDDNRENKQE